MKKFRKTVSLSFSFLALSTLVSTSIMARDLTYKFGMGYRQTTSTWVDESTNVPTRLQLNGVEVSYTLAQDLTVSGFFGTERNLNFMAAGPKLRYDLQRLISRDSLAWQYLHLFTEVVFLAKFGDDAKSGVTIHAPDIGFEVFPFTNNNFAILTSAGLVIDFGGRKSVGFTQGIFGDVGVKYYF